ncbi:MAG: DNA polymerase III subunit delta [Ignavibacteria bacterium GWA2_55_11]|nr:MAG: DNA polymerase III subunit delta [Ignavibacteria bacterium GWA2_55_11]OGU64117.1 MAG: DNA polymerase III subunit delta [Ignavibacteria bacterium RIFCSPHIGHO2_02_FULL_56_12]OGU70222.1 MAG: DNA polymerase III subunit delta [Ignavibacteria bacterium RIFCSPLOWO2_12_FULL_56_21]OGU74171.1 MAG: DNA polymerase III subunit delta [Ignavibacteria bacterium RIFCSPLOWO2_02_FULL_55_14]
MPAHKHDAFAVRVARGEIGPVTLLVGEEALLIDECVDAIVGASVDVPMREFNLDILDGAKTDVRDVLAKASSFPMMSDRRAVVVKSFERLVAGEKARELFAAYVLRPLNSTRLVLIAEAPDFRKKPFTDLKKHADVVEFKKLYENEVPGWIVQRCRTMGKKIDLDAARLLQGYVGDSLMSIQRELEKLITFVGDRSELSVDDVSAIAGASRGFTVFDLQNAIGRRDYRASSSILRKMVESGESPQYIVVMLTRFFTQLWKFREFKQQGLSESEMASQLRMSPFFLRGYPAFLQQFTVGEVEAAFVALRTADSRMKSTGGDAATELDLLVHSIVRSRALAAATFEATDVRV